jgi:hypothetical protein
MCKYYSACNEYVPSRDILKIFVSILLDITDNKYKLGVMSSIFINEDGISYFIKHVYSKNDNDILYDRKTENTLSKQWITENVNPPKIILRNLIVFFNNPHITVGSLSGDIYDFSDKNLSIDDFYLYCKENNKELFLNIQHKYLNLYNPQKIIRTENFEQSIKKLKDINAFNQINEEDLIPSNISKSNFKLSAKNKEDYKNNFFEDFEILCYG